MEQDRVLCTLKTLVKSGSANARIQAYMTRYAGILWQHLGRLPVCFQDRILVLFFLLYGPKALDKSGGGEAGEEGGPIGKGTV